MPSTETPSAHNAALAAGEPERARAVERRMFAVIDVETTGLRPARDRVVEVAVVRLDEACNVVDEWTTLIDPGGQVRGVNAAVIP